MIQAQDIGALHARARHALHVGHPTHRPLSAIYEHVGMRGEEALGRDFHLPVDYSLRPGGDNGKDQFLLLQTGYDEYRWFKADVKAFQKPIHLLVEEGKCHAGTIYLLGDYLLAQDRVVLRAGWEWGRELLKTVPRTFGHSPVSHWIKRGKLRPLAELHARHIREVLL